MPIGGDRYGFTRENVEKSPAQHGVYQLDEQAEVVYIGRASGQNVTIRSRLQAHHAGTGGAGTRNATHYRREVTENAEAREVQLLEEFKQAHGGRLPRYNERVG